MKYTHKKETTHKNKTKKLNCSPMVQGKTVFQTTCFTKDVLMKIKRAYNASHPHQKIVSNSPKTIFKELQQRLSHCTKEDCWLKVLSKKETQFLKNHLFAPKQPSKWAKNPNEWLSNFDILNVLQQYEQKYPHFVFIGPTTIDFDTTLPEYNNHCVEQKLCDFHVSHYVKKNVNKIGVIFNLDKHDEKGSHWVSLFIDLQHKIIFFFDSAGNKTPKEINHFVEKIKKQGMEMKKPLNFTFYENYPTTHQESNTECGMYSLFFIITMLTGNTQYHKNMSLKKKISLFKNEKIHDKYVEKLRNIYFNQ